MTNNHHKHKRPYFPKCIKNDPETQHKILTDTISEHESIHLRRLVSAQKRRFQDGKFDLDLTYITKRIIAFGYPSTDYERHYRNTLPSIIDFFSSYHHHPPHQHLQHQHPSSNKNMNLSFRLYNLCVEQSYHDLVPSNWQSNNVVNASFRFSDHHPPLFEQILPFCQSVHQWLSQNDEHVVAVNCKAGKGRTGFMISAFLLWNGTCDSASESARAFGGMRTMDGKGVTLPSQHRYLSYLQYCLKEKCAFPEKTQVIRLERIVIEGCKSIDTTTSKEESRQLEAQEEQGVNENENAISQLIVEQYKCAVDNLGTYPVIEQAVSFDLSDEFIQRTRSDDHHVATTNDVNENSSFVIDMMNQEELIVSGDVKMALLKPSMKTAAYLWLNTNFLHMNQCNDSTETELNSEDGDNSNRNNSNHGIQRHIRLTKSEIEGPHRDKKHTKFSRHFSVQVYYSVIERTTWQEHSHSKDHLPVLVGEFSH